MNEERGKWESNYTKATDNCEILKESYILFCIYFHSFTERERSGQADGVGNKVVSRAERRGDGRHGGIQNI